MAHDHPKDWDLVAYDPVNRRLVAWGRLGSDHDLGVDDQGGVAAFDAVTREWTILLEPGKG